MARARDHRSRHSEIGQDPTAPAPLKRAERDVVALGILVAAILMFVGTGSSVMSHIVRSYVFGEANSDAMLGNALILNIALIIFGWRRYAELTREVGERRKAEETAQLLAHTDPLTGCLNRRSLDGAIEDLIRRSAAAGEDVVLAMIDLDKFKRSNDLHGHQAGDAVLVETARRIRGLLPERSVLARLGGDEFTCAAAFAPGHLAAIENLAARLNEAIALPIAWNGITIEITGSIGLARGEAAPDVTAQEQSHRLQHRADLAMYQAKKGGRNRYCWFDPGMEQELQFRSEFERGIREGVLRGEFVPFYEKQIDLESGELTGFEMLARWRSPRHGLVSPEVFIPIAEEIGVIADLSESLIRQALVDAREWNPALSLSVNISPIQLRDPWFAQKLLKLLVEANFPPSRLDIEITETCLHENLAVVRSLITSLRNQGITISLDDFGTGYSSLSQLRTLPFDRIKIDRSFVSSLGKNKDSSTIVEAISSLGKGMDLPITAEGIENGRIHDELRKYGNFKGQGYLYGEPESAEDVRRALAEQNLLVTPPLPADPAKPDLPHAVNG
ncbi:EAL domain-containing protein [Novosphingobium sp. KCTC 2891]|uniref:putative bifunctional diguanylate cyclase/phosphodiesterase n=1 Tax=Novosphingobium sp. KCTC 2891 TaxID=2989730 RepID=UPI002221C27D|nr:EAL domain-containing protein [Novosphingobium sp. KCTC 2891]MCW1382821.1 EAL domain-containing protein [Novosphingobium sp. KCTC 2891]